MESLGVEGEEGVPKVLLSSKRHRMSGPDSENNGETAQLEFRVHDPVLRVSGDQSNSLFAQIESRVAQNAPTVGTPRVEGDEAYLEVFPNSAHVPMSRPGFGTKGETILMRFRVNDPTLCASGVSRDSEFTEIGGRVLSAPKLKVGNGKDLFPQNGRWNFDNKKLAQPTKIEHWAIVNFSVSCDVQMLWRDLVKCREQKSILVKDPCVVNEENPSVRTESPDAGVENMFEQMKGKLKEAPQFLLCFVPERKNPVIYGLWVH